MAILAAEESAPDGQMLVPLDTDMCRRMLDVKAAALLVLRLLATDHGRVVEVGRCGGFQVIYLQSLLCFVLRALSAGIGCE